MGYLVGLTICFSAAVHTAYPSVIQIDFNKDGEYSGGTLQVVISGDPSALIFKDRLYGELKANICGDCGHVELRVANPKELYRHYRKSSE